LPVSGAVILSSDTKCKKQYQNLHFVSVKSEGGCKIALFFSSKIAKRILGGGGLLY
jgi:hypothetical protein